MKSRHIVVTTFGSFGDLHPYIAVGLELQQRGHRVTIATSAIYREKVEALGLGFHAVRPDLPDFDAVAEFAKQMMDVRKGTENLIRHLLAPAIRDTYEDLLQVVKGADLLVSHTTTLAAPLVAANTGIRWVSTVLAPITMLSAYDPAIMPIVGALYPLYSRSPSTARVMFGAIQAASRTWVQEIYNFRRELRLPPGPHPLFRALTSPQLHLAMFSPLLGKPQPDWSAQTRQTGFAFYDTRGAMWLRTPTNLQAGEVSIDKAQLSPELQQFLDSGPAPIVFTLGTAALLAPGDFFRESVVAAQRLGQRAVLLAGTGEGLPSTLPDGIAAFDYAPYSQLFPRASVIVHQGGVGTTAQAMRAGRPMLVMPYTHDQPDNAARMVRLGIGRTVARSHYQAPRVTEELALILKNPQIGQKAALVGQQISAESGTIAACDALEEQL